AAAVGPDLLDQAARARRAGEHVVGVALERRARRRLLRQHLGVAEDAAEDVVEVVRDAAGEAPDGFHLLRLAQALLQPAALGLCSRFLRVSSIQRQEPSLCDTLHSSTDTLPGTRSSSSRSCIAISRNSGWMNSITSRPRRSSRLKPSTRSIAGLAYRMPPPVGRDRISASALCSIIAW